MSYNRERELQMYIGERKAVIERESDWREELEKKREMEEKRKVC